MVGIPMKDLTSKMSDPFVPTNILVPSSDKHTLRITGCRPKLDMSKVAPGSKRCVQILIRLSFPPVRTPCSQEYMAFTVPCRKTNKMIQ